MDTKNSFPVREVTLMEDRAHVLRVGTAQMEAGEHELRIEGVAPALVDKTLNVTLTGEAKLIEARVDRGMIHLDSERAPEVREAEARIREIEAELAKIKGAEAENVRSSKQYLQVFANVAGEIAQDASWGQGDASSWGGALRHVRNPVDGLLEERVKLVRERVDLEDKLRDLKKIAESASTSYSKENATITVRVACAAQTEAQVRVDYITPGALWRPYHTAQLRGGGLSFRSDACVWQKTGEDWKDVKLYFSTERPSLGVEPPQLATDRVRSFKTDSTVRVETREEVIHHAGLGGKTKEVAEVPGIDDGGDALKLEASHAMSIPSDGRPYRAPLFEFDSAASSDLRLTGELARAVILRTEHVNEASRPILAGPVDLVRDSGIIGRTSILYVAPGEKFELGWGPELDLRVYRDHEELPEKGKALSNWYTTGHRVELKVSNLGTTEHVISVTERIPVSEVEKVKIEVEPAHTTEDVLPDKDGFVKWTLTLPPRGHRMLKLGYAVRRHKDVVGT